MEQLSRRSLVRGATLLTPALILTDPADAAVAAAARKTRRRGCAPAAKVPLLLRRDMTGKHAGRMHGVPSNYNWAMGPRVGVGNRPDRYGFTHISSWGQIYEDINGSPARNVRVACRDISLWILSARTGKWRRTNASKEVNGANYVEDFAGNASKPAPLRRERDGSVSATLGEGYNFHLYATRARSHIDPEDVAGVIAMFSARVIKDDPNGPDERRRARYLASAGADYWLDAYVGATPSTHADAGIGKARYLSPRWLTLTMSTLSLRKLRENPPPICLRGRG